MPDILFSHKNVEAFPVGSIFISSNNTNPNELLGYGTWELVSQNRMIMGCSEDDEETSTGGKSSITLSSSQMPSHTHQIPAHNHTAGCSKNDAHTHAIQMKAAGTHGHANSITVAGTHGHKYTLGSSSHSHTITINSSGSHTHGIRMNTLAGPATHNHSRGTWTKDSSYVSEGTKYGDDSASFFGVNDFVVMSGGGHSHTASSGSSSHTHALSIVQEGGHTHAISITENGSHTHDLTISSTEGHAHSITVNDKAAFNTGSAGSGSAIDITNPYLKLFIWKRTA